jgi:hypothetical protein
MSNNNSKDLVSFIVVLKLCEAMFTSRDFYLNDSTFREI